MKSIEIHKALIGITSHSMEGRDQFKKLANNIRQQVESVEISSIYSFRGTREPFKNVHDVKASPLIDGLSLAFLTTIRWTPEEAHSYLKGIERVLSVEALLLAYDDLSKMTPHLTLPHPDFHIRPELLIPSVEVWGDYSHPVLNQSLYSLGERFSEQKWGEFYAQGKSVLDF